MAKIKNDTLRTFNLPVRSSEGRKREEQTGRRVFQGETFGPVTLEPGATVEVPEYYVKALREESLLELDDGRGGTYSVLPPKGAAGAFEARVRAYREGGGDDAARERARADAAERRLRAVEAELAAQKRGEGGSASSDRSTSPSGERGTPGERGPSAATLNPGGASTTPSSYPPDSGSRSSGSKKTEK